MLSAVKCWLLRQFDIHNAFLNVDLHEEVYMQLSPGLTVQGEYARLVSQANLVYRLKKSLYGLKQSSRQLNCKFTECLLAYGFKESKAYYSLFLGMIQLVLLPSWCK